MRVVTRAILGGLAVALAVSGALVGAGVITQATGSHQQVGVHRADGDIKVNF